ncbi:hypothetical protein PFISCL1PPCAC_5402, partial [Pristionchus fissidentatus]
FVPLFHFFKFHFDLLYFRMAAKKYVDVMKMFLKLEKGPKNFSSIVNTCRLVKAEEGNVSVEFEVDDRMVNHFGTLHGGCSATMVDVITTGALVATPRGMPGVSVDLHMTYLAAAKLGDTVQLDAEVIRSGKSMAFTKASLYRKPEMTLIATGLHTKAFPAHAKIRKDVLDGLTRSMSRLVFQRAAQALTAPGVNPVYYERMNRFFAMDHEDKTFTGLVWNAEITDVQELKLSAEFTVDKHKIQHFGTLHGGCSATMVDCLTCAAVIVATGRPAVSVNLNMTYLNPAPLGSLVRLDAEVVKHGRSLAYTRAQLIRVEDGVEIACAKHTLAFSSKVYVRDADDKEYKLR